MRLAIELDGVRHEVETSQYAETATLADLDPRVSPELGRWAVANCALMRNRTTVVDLLTCLGWWEPDDVDEVLERSQGVPRASQRGGAT